MIQIAYRNPIGTRPATLAHYMSGATPMTFAAKDADASRITKGLLGYSTAEVTAEVTEISVFLARWIRETVDRLLLNAVRVKSLEVFTMQEGTSMVLLEGVMRGTDEVSLAVRRFPDAEPEIEFALGRAQDPDSVQSVSTRIPGEELEHVDTELAYLELDELTPISRDLVKVLDSTDRLLALTFTH